MPKLVGVIKYEGKPFTGMLIVNDVNGNLMQYAVKDGKPKSDINLRANFYTVQYVLENAPLVSSYPQYKWQVPESEPLDFDKIVEDQLV